MIALSLLIALSGPAQAASGAIKEDPCLNPNPVRSAVPNTAVRASSVRIATPSAASAASNPKRRLKRLKPEEYPCEPIRPVPMDLPPLAYLEQPPTEQEPQSTPAPPDWYPQLFPTADGPSEFANPPCDCFSETALVPIPFPTTGGGPIVAPGSSRAVPLQPIPEPSTWALLSLSLTGAILWAKRRRAR